MAVYKVFITVGSLMLGAVFSGDFAEMNMIDSIVFIIAILIAFIGVIMVAFKLDDMGRFESRRSIVTDAVKSEYFQTDLDDNDIINDEVELVDDSIRKVSEIEHQYK